MTKAIKTSKTVIKKNTLGNEKHFVSANPNHHTQPIETL